MALGVNSIQRYHLTSIENSIVEIRRSYNCLISTMGFPIHCTGKTTSLYWIRALVVSLLGGVWRSLSWGRVISEPQIDTIVYDWHKLSIDNPWSTDDLFYWHIWGLCCQKQVYQAEISNYMPEWDVITYPYLRYLFLATKSTYIHDFFSVTTYLLF